MRAPLLLVAACLVLFFTGLGSVPFYTRGEPREALVAREMIRTGEWLVPARPDGELTRKPPIFYWAAATSLSLLPERPELAARLPSALLATAGVLLTWAVVQASFGAAIAFPAALMLATSLEWIRAATVARVDMALVAGLTLLFGAWLVALARDRPALGPRFFVMAAAGAVVATLAKGPVALVLPALVAGVLLVARREWRVLRRLDVITVLLVGGAVAGLWYVAAFAKHGWAFFDIVAKENWLRYIDTEDARTGHSHGFIYLPLVGLVGLMPWTPLLPLAGAPLVEPSRRTPAVTFAASWVTVTLVFFSLAAAKRSVYLLPLFPALALLLALGVEQPPRSGRLAWLTRVTSALYAPVLVLLALGAVALAFGGDVVGAHPSVAQAARRAEHAGDRVGGQARDHRAPGPGRVHPGDRGARGTRPARRQLAAPGDDRRTPDDGMDRGHRAVAAPAARPRGEPATLHGARRRRRPVRCPAVRLLHTRRRPPLLRTAPPRGLASDQPRTGVPAALGGRAHALA